MRKRSRMKIFLLQAILSCVSAKFQNSYLPTAIRIGVNKNKRNSVKRVKMYKRTGLRHPNPKCNKELLKHPGIKSLGPITQKSYTVLLAQPIRTV